MVVPVPFPTLDPKKIVKWHDQTNLNVNFNKFNAWKITNVALGALKQSDYRCDFRLDVGFDGGGSIFYIIEKKIN